MRLLFLVMVGLLAACVSSVGAQPDSLNLGTHVFPIVNGKGQVLGTAFRICRPNVVLTATHVIEGNNFADLYVSVPSLEGRTSLTPTRIVKHLEADVAAMFFKEADTAELECFNLGVLSNDRPDFTKYPIGEDISSFGFPKLKNPTGPRMMKGHIQAHFQAEGESYGGYRYAAYELAFPAFSGMSGSPVLREQNRHTVIGVVTASTTYASLGDRMNTRADWAVGAALPPLTEWLEVLAKTPDALQ